MDEKQITDRPAAGRADPGITNAVPERPAAAPPAAAAPPRRKWRWWMPAAILVLMGGLIAFIRFSGKFPGDEATTSLATKAAYVLTVVLLAFWYVFFTGLRWRTRLLLAGVGVLLVAGFLVAFRLDGATGDMSLHFVWRWAAPRDAALPKLTEGAVAAGRDATVRPGDFPQFLGPHRDAVVDDVRLDPDWAAHPPQQIWRQPIGAGWGAFAVAGDLAITQEQRGDEELIVARDRKTGEPVWSHGNGVRFVDQTRMGGDGPRATPTVAGGKVFAHGATGVLDCLDVSTGKVLSRDNANAYVTILLQNQPFTAAVCSSYFLTLPKLLWSHDTLKESGEQNIQWGVSASPLVIEDLGLVVISLGSGGPGGTLAAYDVNTGERKWVAGTDKASYASPMLATLSGKRQIVSVNDKTVTGHDPADGRVLWTYLWKEAPAKASQPPVLPGDRLLLTAGYGVPGVLLQVRRDGEAWTTEELWTTNRMRTKFTTPVVRDHYAYGLDDGVLSCIDLDNDGGQVWQADRANRYGHGQVLLVGDLLLVQAEAGEIVLVEASPKGFHKLGVLPAFTSKTWNNPALAGNHLFVRNDQEAACYELATLEKPKEK